MLKDARDMRDPAALGAALLALRKPAKGKPRTSPLSKLYDRYLAG